MQNHQLIFHLSFQWKKLIELEKKMLSILEWIEKLGPYKIYSDTLHNVGSDICRKSLIYGGPNPILV